MERLSHSKINVKQLLIQLDDDSWHQATPDLLALLHKYPEAIALLTENVERVRRD